MAAAANPATARNTFGKAARRRSKKSAATSPSTARTIAGNASSWGTQRRQYERQEEAQALTGRKSGNRSRTSDQHLHQRRGQRTYNRPSFARSRCEDFQSKRLSAL